MNAKNLKFLLIILTGWIFLGAISGRIAYEAWTLGGTIAFMIAWLFTIPIFMVLGGASQ